MKDINQNRVYGYMLLPSIEDKTCHCDRVIESKYYFVDVLSGINKGQYAHSQMRTLAITAHEKQVTCKVG